MKNIKNRKIAITILTGFLGSGKTTFLKNYVNYLLNNQEKPRVIVNEYGNLDVDSYTLGNQIEVASILNGCVCCDSQLDLIKQLKHFINKSAMHHIIIEATGIAHPLEIIAACQDPEIAESVDVPTIIGLVDGPQFLKRKLYTNNTKDLMEEQLKVCHAIIVNKMDLVKNDTKAALNDLEELNPNAAIEYTTYAECDIAQLLYHSNVSSTSDITRHGHHNGINSLVYTFTGPIDRQLFYQFILRLSDNVLRLKGYVKFHDAPMDTYEFQYANGLPDYHVINQSMELKIVLIGEQLDINQLRNKLDVIQFT
ncbi:GTP-binding protein [Staphylococcus sp. ACRSN]|uniref:CobW family GTP-binding protein n=1 Tax=Staphylococcus sp. ACRSN TaxID=2918214 RepID=UPI001EF17734|nr:GTP-binding protein [Staphylococcus sp. ACRSN]MCG7339773.1 GTP-binding protein [Staphylococcus sp. ACRSN]